jgi:hypothetical protein
MSKFCPLIKVACKKNECEFWNVLKFDDEQSQECAISAIANVAMMINCEVSDFIEENEYMDEFTYLEHKEEMNEAPVKQIKNKPYCFENMVLFNKNSTLCQCCEVFLQCGKIDDKI